MSEKRIVFVMGVVLLLMINGSFLVVARYPAYAGWFLTLTVLLGIRYWLRVARLWKTGEKGGEK